MIAQANLEFKNGGLQKYKVIEELEGSRGSKRAEDDGPRKHRIH